MKNFCLFFLLSFVFLSIAKADYSQEFKSAYSWAYNNWITTQPTIDRANMNWEISRIELAKMISNYAIRVLKKKWDTTRKCVFTDITSDLDKQFDKWVTNACQLWLMWQWINKFRPYDKVTRAEFWTILSRLLYWTKFDWWNPYYIRHLNKLKIVWIMWSLANADKKNESRGNVMTMLKRSTEWLDKIPAFSDLDDSVFQCQECYLDGCTYEPLQKRAFLIPYKNWYIWYNGVPADMDGMWYSFEYRELDDPCRVLYSFGSILYYKYDDISINKKCYLYEYLTNSRIDSFSSKSTDFKQCFKDADKFFYNLITWKDIYQNFTNFLNVFKKSIDKHERVDYKKYYDCMNKLSEEQNKDFNVDEYMKDFTEEKFYADAAKSEAQKKENSKYCIDQFFKNY